LTVEQRSTWPRRPAVLALSIVLLLGWIVALLGMALSH
jgi:hypothetical protein